jgi:hypothetical protein
MNSAERTAAYRARRRGDPEAPPKGGPGPKPAGWLTTRRSAASPRRLSGSPGLSRGHGLRRWSGSASAATTNVSDLVTAHRSRQKADRDQAERRVGQLASAILKVRRRCTLAHGDWARNLSSANLDALRSEMHARRLLEAELRDLCCSDEQLITAVMKVASA